MANIEKYDDFSTKNTVQLGERGCAALRPSATVPPRGFMKVVVAQDSDEILGFSAYGFEASELMIAMQTAMLGHLPCTVLRDAILTHPTNV
jgi:pyruvate/2-oxoglutarate dehydrogenase complex dihydrolipoamide dehydrogenase (E3) component